MKPLFVLAAVAASFSTLAVAQTQRDLDSHVHGQATLNIAIAEPSVFIELNTPWNNLVGFEHTPETDEQRAMVDNALEQLNNPAELFLFDAGDCSIDEVIVENGLSSDLHAGEHEDHSDEHGGEHAEKHDDDHGEEHAEKHNDEHGEEHAEKHDEEHGDEHAENHDDDEHSEESDSHSTVLVTYSYNCQQPDKLSSIELTLFSIWSGFEDIDVQLIGEKGQALEELNPNNTAISLESVN